MSHIPAQTPDQVTLGIDVSKGQLDVHLHPQGLAQRFTNDRKGHARLIAWISPRQPTRIVFEATGAYHRALEMALGKAALPAVKVNPLQARRFAEATGRRVKTDPVDAAPDIASNVLRSPASAPPCSQKSQPQKTKPLIALPNCSPRGGHW